MKGEILYQLDFTNWDVCVDYTKSKQAKHTSKHSVLSSKPLKLIYKNIRCLFDIPSRNDEKYFITFIGDFSQYCYLYLLDEEFQSVNILEAFINKVKRHLDKKVKVVRSDRGDEYYSKFDESGQRPCPFAKFLESRGICV